MNNKDNLAVVDKENYALVDSEGQGLLFPQDKMSTLRKRLKESEKENGAMKRLCDFLFGACNAAHCVIDRGEDCSNDFLVSLLEAAYAPLVDDDVRKLFNERYDYNRDIPF